MTEPSSVRSIRDFSRRNFVKLAGLAALGMTFPRLAYGAESDDLDAKAKALEGNLADQQAQYDELSAKLDVLKQQVNDALVAYDKAAAAHEAAVQAVEDAQVRVDNAEAALADIQTQLSDRVTNIYRQGEPGIFDVFFDSSSFEEFVTSWDAMSRISAQDADLVQQSKDAKAEAEAAHKEYAEQEAKAAEELQKATKAKDDLEAAQETLQKQVDKMDQDIIDLQQEIEATRMDADAAREKEEAAAKAAAEALAKQKSTARSSASYSSASRSTSPSISVDGWVNPAPGKHVTSPFGWRASTGTFHQGVDLSCSYEPCYAIGDGTVSFTGWLASTSGLSVAINHGGGTVSWYLHGSEALVSSGSSVSAGQQVMITGNTGHSTGPHLHFQINVNSPDGIYGTAVDPQQYFSW